MKQKLIEKFEPLKTKKKGKIVTVQVVEDILVLNCYIDKKLVARYGMHTKTHEYRLYVEKNKIWTGKKLLCAFGYDPLWQSETELEKNVKIEDGGESIIKAYLKYDAISWKAYIDGAFRLICEQEKDYIRDRAERTENRRQRNIKELMNRVPQLPTDFTDNIVEQAVGNLHFAFFNKESEKWKCTACGKESPDKFLHRQDDKKKSARHNDWVICPRCKTEVQAKKRTDKVEVIEHAVILQKMDEELSVARHIDVDIYWRAGERNVELSEAVRIFLEKRPQKYLCTIYYGQIQRDYADLSNQYFDRTNPVNRRTYTAYMYPNGITEALEGTGYSDWARTFEQMAAAGQKANYNRLMVLRNDRNMIGTVEYLLKGRFTRLLEETAESVSLWYGEYSDKTLNPRGNDIEEIFKISDRQKINRIRDCNGGEKIVQWMQWSDETGNKISEETLDWLVKNNLERGDLQFVSDRMTPQQIMNYVKRQQSELKKSVSAILDWWKDYLSMAEKLHKKVMDEMVYRPRELKRRHDELVEEINAQKIRDELKQNKDKRKKEAQKMREKYPKAEGILKEVQSLYSYQSEEYIMLIPKNLMEIVAEGQALHHCVGSSDRYFDRIESRETYLGFLRKVSEPEIPYYTIEFQPGGTIRQHRSLYDEEPNVDQIRGFLKLWQKEVKKRITDKERHWEKISKEKEIVNIEELRNKRNTKVLNALMQDFMEA